MIVQHLREANTAEEIEPILRGICEYVIDARRNGDDDGHFEIVEEGGIEAILDKMKPPLRTNSGIQASCCDTLRFLMSDEIDHKERLSEAGGVQSIMQVLFKHQQDETVQLKGLFLLENLSWDAKIARAIANSGGLIALNDARGFFPDNRDIQVSAGQILRNIIQVEDAMEAWRPGNPTPWMEYGSYFLDPDP